MGRFSTTKRFSCTKVTLSRVYLVLRPSLHHLQGTSLYPSQSLATKRNSPPLDLFSLFTANFPDLRFSQSHFPQHPSASLDLGVSLSPFVLFLTPIPSLRLFPFVLPLSFPFPLDRSRFLASLVLPYRALRFSLMALSYPSRATIALSFGTLSSILLLLRHVFILLVRQALSFYRLFSFLLQHSLLLHHHHTHHIH